MNLGDMLAMMSPPKPAKRRVFVSYHHGSDQWWADFFKQLFSEGYEVFYDTSLDEPVRSGDPHYVNRTIREDYIVGSSVTLVLCGAETWKRKFVDWEIYSTLHHQHALLGIALPTAVKDWAGRVIVPSRLHANIATGYAGFMNWTQDPAPLKTAIELAYTNSKRTLLIDNTMPKMQRNLT